MGDAGLIAIRWALYVDLGLLFGLPLFALYALGGGRTAARYLPMSAILAALALVGLMLSSLGFMAQVSAMTGLPLTRPDVSILGDLLNETALGLALKARIAALLILLLCALLCSRAPRVAAAASTLAGACALATLAWGGHGGAGEGGIGWLQLVTDLVHLLAAGAWIGAIAAFLLLALRWVDADDMDHVSLTEAALRGFATVGSLVVGLLILTGAVNGAILVGPGNILSLGKTTYGLLLIAKLSLFAAMLGLAALNRYRLTPALGLAVAQGDARCAMAILRRSLLAEGGLAIVILALVAWLGTLSPPMST
ncbi:MULTISPECIES: copper homeostasis membrane protein CopD [Sphingomonadales]|uniref:copper homeostasis membrane protein CopD n=1 Tax=Sphingomonadales TaxID=204457 RepID=UPI000C613F80|nr:MULTISPECIES: copper homeostasis membrane protein CopD [Sphingomonadaceae]MBS88167.1 copper resistance protein CopD [Sphingobium sp.]MCW1431938.1 copper homeostasis membrane protein CopD [Novosphingobium sp. JCM 18896]